MHAWQVPLAHATEERDKSQSAHARKSADSSSHNYDSLASRPEDTKAN